MRYLSVCSGIEAATVAWNPLGWEPAAFAEIDKFPCAVLAHHYPSVPNWGDLTRFHEWPESCSCSARSEAVQSRREDDQQSQRNGAVGRPSRDRDRQSTRSGLHGERAPAGHRHHSSGGLCERCGGAIIDLLVGGTPCQSFSVAGLRAGLADPRGNLALTYLAVADKYRPRWLVWENVPGVLSADDGGALGAFLGGLAELGYGFAYRVLDAQYFGLAQRRARVFVVGHLGDWRRAAAVLFERESLSGHPTPRREAGEDAAECVAGSLGSRGNRSHTELDGHGAYVHCADVAPTLNAHFGDKQGLEDQHALNGAGLFVAHSLRADGFDASEDGTGRGTPLVPTIAPCLTQTVAFHENQRAEVVLNDTAGSLKVGGGKPGQGYPAILQAVAFSAKDYGGDAGDLAPTLRAGGHTSSHANGGVMSAVAFLQEDYAGAYEADASSVLSTLRHTVGAEAVAEWGSRILDSLQSPEVLRAWLHGESLRRASGDFHAFVDDCPLPRQEGSAAATLRQVWEQGPDGRSPQGRGLAKQLAQQLGKALPELPYTRAPQPTLAVRRLTPREAERLQGFPDDYTLIPYRGKPAADGPKYKALGNSMAVPVMAWIGRRIQLVEDVCAELEEQSA